MSSDITISSGAFAKMILHAAKYPYAAVNGIILASSKVKDRTETLVLDAIPLFHGQLGLAPMMEVALTQIEQCYKSEGLYIAGYYQANEHVKDNTPDFIALKVAEKIAENGGDAYLIMIDNRKVCATIESPPIIVSYLTSEGKWKNKEKTSVHMESGASDVTSQLLQKKVYNDLIDFDNHLNDIKCNWSNRYINQLIKTTNTSKKKQT